MIACPCFFLRKKQVFFTIDVDLLFFLAKEKKTVLSRKSKQERPFFKAILSDLDMLLLLFFPVKER